jgi:hypothetical protein
LCAPYALVGDRFDDFELRQADRVQMLLCGQQLFSGYHQLLGWEGEKPKTKPVITCLFSAPER